MQSRSNVRLSNPYEIVEMVCERGEIGLVRKGDTVPVGIALASYKPSYRILYDLLTVCFNVSEMRSPALRACSSAQSIIAQKPLL